MSTVPPAFPQGDHTADASRTEVGKGLAINSVICGAIGSSSRRSGWSP